MYIQNLRLKDDGKSTIGTMHINGTFKGFTLEDTFNDPKIPGETCIPAGKYDIKLRDVGGMTAKYRAKYGDLHKGMLWLQDVPGFEWVYIHTGNTHAHTEGCILVGSGCNSGEHEQTITSSVVKYKELYKDISEAILRGEEVTIEII